MNYLKLNPESCEEVQKLFEQIFSKTDATEISEGLNLILDTYVQNADHDRLTMANNVTLLNKLSSMFFMIENCIKEKPVKKSTDITNPQCLHN